MRQTILVGLLAVSIPLSGCAYYHLEDRGTPAAAFRFNYAGGMSQYSVVQNDPCEKGARLAKLGYSDSSIKTVKVAAGKSIRIKARTPFHDPSYFNLAWCESVAELTPQPGHSYRAWHYQPKSHECVLKVEDEAEKAAPSDLVVQDTLPCPPIFVSW